MNPKDFYTAYISFAKQNEQQTNVPYLVTLAQAALESGWGKNAPGNNFFGMKAHSNPDDEHKQLLTTHEYFGDNQQGHKFPEVISITDITKPNCKPVFEYVVKDWFMKYDTPADSFNDHSKLFIRKWQNGSYIYPNAVELLNYAPVDAGKFVDAIAPVYSTSPNYAKLLHEIMEQLEGYEEDI